ncbi:uncharacterized protein (DUF305 family) [Knoellia remsis]|uniref:Uncharacterized protein (DUF305 family) n=1 Tax=Knoellia remsis TaxID=407159 RepID=A0A2T0U688_9MICO|nr:DUF305 domain-containing protein [Knoellia remsis]PRY53427.1 uncharacterized protein (DUF305 family) [Knoellia remsis]
MPRPHAIARRATVGVTAALTLAVLAGCGSDDSDSSMPGMSMSPSGSSSPGASASAADQGDVMFAQMMIPHHQQAIEMADLALKDTAGASAEVKALAGDIRAAQGPEIEQMRGWLESWGARAEAPMDHDMSGMMSKEDMAALSKATGPAFDRQWLTMMIEHHEGAVTMAQDVLKTTKNPDVEKLANAIVDSQTKEIATMKDLLS